MHDFHGMRSVVGRLSLTFHQRCFKARAIFKKYLISYLYPILSSYCAVLILYRVHVRMKCETLHTAISRDMSLIHVIESISDAALALFALAQRRTTAGSEVGWRPRRPRNSSISEQDITSQPRNLEQHNSQAASTHLRTQSVQQPNSSLYERLSSALMTQPTSI